MYWLVFLALHGLLTVAACLDILLHYRRPTSAVAWLYTVATLPVIGVTVYLAFGVYRGTHKIRRHRRRARAMRRNREQHSESAEAIYRRGFDRPGFAALMTRTCAFQMSRGNAITLLDVDSVALARQMECIADAKREVVLSTYILAPGQIQRMLFEALAGAARRGVVVRLLVDGFGSYRLTLRVLRELGQSGAEWRFFQQPNPLRGRIQINFRNHRKTLLIDGQVAFTGGRNWSDDYYSCAPGSTFCDTSFEVRGPVLTAMRRVFYEDWALADGATEPPQIKGIAGIRPVTGGNMAIRALPGGLDEPSDDMATVLGGAFRGARHSILIVTPYFAPEPRVYDALRLAALSGVDVRVLAPLNSDRRTIDLAARTCYRGLMKAGVRVWLRPMPFLHSKAIVVDDAWATVGSVNFDARSMALNFELNLEIVDAAFARRLRASFDDDFAVSSELDATEFCQRPPFTQRLLENAAALFAPIL
ncbi:MAG: cardiolipin synthase [Planctomycetota bacterium]|jgi:cardiolipin synthase